jgi:class 3 adenylate cyclase
VLSEYHGAMGQLIMAYGGTLERFAGDAIMTFFNDPIPVPDAAQRALRMALDMRAKFAALAVNWKKRGYDLDMGIGIGQGYATLGAIGFEGRRDYGAIGAVCCLAARLCAEAKGGEILVSQRVMGSLEDIVVAERKADLTLNGFHRPVPAYNAIALKSGAAAACMTDPVGMAAG